MTIPIIGLLGHAGCGKDTVADWFVKEKKFVKLAFADPIKRIAKGLFGYSTEELWGPSELRNQGKPMPFESWQKMLENFGLLAGRYINELFPADHGNPNGLRIVAYAKLMRTLSELARDYHDKELSPRIVLQILGTEWGRSVDPLLWAKFTYDKVIPDLLDGRWYSDSGGPCGANLREAAESVNELHHGPLYQGIIITDHRFKNEVELTKQRGGYVVRLARPFGPNPHGNVGIPGHASEREQQEVDMAADMLFIAEEGLDNLYTKLETMYELAPWRDAKPSS